MKLSKYILISVLALALFACKEEEGFGVGVAGFEFFSSLDNENSMFVEVGDKIDFRDVSRNAVSHTWSIGEGTSLLSQKFSNQDTIFDKFIIAGTETSEATVSVLFQESGLREVQLANTYNDSVGWFLPGYDYSLSTVKNASGQWAIDTTFVVDVFEKLAPTFSVSLNGEQKALVSSTEIPSLSDSDSWPTVEIEEGDELVFTDLTSIGRPTGRTWNLDIGNDASSNAEELTQAYNIVGDYLAGTMTIRRSGEGMPNSEMTRYIPLKITVGYSTAPITFDEDAGIAESEDQTISVSLKAPIANFSGKESNFTVHVTNAAAGFDSNIAVTTARRSASNEQVIELILADPIYNSDDITVTYDGLGDISNEVGFRTLAAFGPESVNSYFDPANYIGSTPDGLAWAGFEVEWTDHEPGTNGYDRRAGALNYWAGKPTQSYNPDGTLAWLRDESISYPEDGNIASMKFEAVAGITASSLLQGSPNGLTSNEPIPAGTYSASFYVYLDAANTMSTITKEVSSPLVTVDYDISSIARGEWVRVSQVITLASTPDSRWDTIIDPAKNLGAATGLQKFYMDKQAWTLWELRP